MCPVSRSDNVLVVLVGEPPGLDLHTFAKHNVGDFANVTDAAHGIFQCFDSLFAEPRTLHSIQQDGENCVLFFFLGTLWFILI